MTSEWETSKERQATYKAKKGANGFRLMANGHMGKGRTRREVNGLRCQSRTG